MKLETKLGDQFKDPSQADFNLVLSPEELIKLDEILKAGITTDPIIRNVPQQDTEALSQKISRIRALPLEHEINITFSRIELSQIDSIADSICVQGMEGYAPHLMHFFPDEEALDQFTDEIQDVYQKSCLP